MMKVKKDQQVKIVQLKEAHYVQCRLQNHLELENSK